MKEILQRRRAMTGRGSPYAHGTWEDLFYHVDRGDYAAAYQRGETFPLDLGSPYGVVNMEISDFDYDVLASDTARRAPVTMVARELLAVTHRWNPALEGTEPPYTAGTGAVGGWPASEIRTWMIGNILPAVPASIRRRIVAAAKYSQGFLPDGTKVSGLSSEDMLFLPSARECGRNSVWDGARAGLYTALNSNEKRAKHKAGGTEPIRWWTRSSSYDAVSKAVRIHFSGDNARETDGSTTDPSIGICICFCIGGRE